MKRFRGLTYALLAAVILVAAAGHLDAAYPTPAPAASPYLIDISNNAFSPSSLTVPVGSTVTWKNDDPYAHTVTMSGKGGFDSGNLNSGKTFSNTFSKAGTYTYVCSIHPSMTGTITVTAPST